MIAAREVASVARSRTDAQMRKAVEATHCKLRDRFIVRRPGSPQVANE
jgi:hypothetical protein